jgi:hydroxylamine reductase
MFCNQCEQTANGKGCERIGVCGKNEEVAALQDLLVHSLKNLSAHAVQAREKGIVENEIDRFVCQGLFSTLTNVNFDPQRFVSLIHDAALKRMDLKKKIQQAGGVTDVAIEECKCHKKQLPELVARGKEVGVAADADLPEDIRSLHQILLYGLKGVAAYLDHAAILGKEDDAVYAAVHEGLASLLNKTLGADELVPLVLKCGETNLKAMGLLDAGHTERFGHPVPTPVPRGTRKGKAILVSGHDLMDLEALLIQTQGKGIDIYTHGEMLPAHGYPELEKYSHLYGHYGTAWQNQKKEFADFPGAILLTTNCLRPPKDAYKQNLFTTGLVGHEGVAHVSRSDFSQVIDCALAMPGFTEFVEVADVMTGFARNAVLGVADKIIDAVKQKQLRHFFLVAGCDGAKPGRNYYTEFVEKVPADCVVLTLACGKFRFFDKDMGDIGGIPRLLDVGQCNDAYSAVQIAVALAGAFECDVNDLPLSMVLSWYEQKAVAILLTLFHLGIKNIRLGPSLPAFITPGVLDILVKTFNIMPITTPDEDLKAILG